MLKGNAVANTYRVTTSQTSTLTIMSGEYSIPSKGDPKEQAGTSEKRNACNDLYSLVTENYLTDILIW